jgi:hypothetical protein
MAKMDTLLASLGELNQQIAVGTEAAMAGLADLRAAIADKRKEIQYLRQAPPPRAEVEAGLLALLERRYRDHHAQMHQRVLAAVASPGRGWPAPHPGEGYLMPLAEALLYAALKAGVPQYVTDMPYSPGEATESRPARIAALEAELAKLEASEVEVVDAMRSRGLAVEHRPEVRQRREQEARRQALQQEDEAERRAAEQRLDAAHAERAGKPATRG